MAYFTLVLHDGETRQRTVMHIDGAESVKMERPQMETVERLPHRGTYLGQYGEGIITATWDVFFGREDRLVNNVPTSGNEQFLQFRTDIWERWSTLKSSPSRKVKEATRLEYHGWERQEHFWATVHVLEDSQDQDNPTTFEGTVVFKLYEPISGEKITVTRPDSHAVAQKAVYDFNAFLEDVGTFNQKLRGQASGVLEQIDDLIFKPTKQLLAALDSFTKGATEAVLFPINAVNAIGNNIGNIITRLGSTLSWPVAQAANTLRNVKRTINRLINVSSIFKQSLVDAGEDFKNALFELEDPLDSYKEKARKRSGSNLDKLAYARAQSFSSTGARSIRASAGDTLQGIALRELGDSSRWREIALLNDLSSSSQLTSGLALLIPQDEAGAARGVRGGLSSDGITPEERFYGRDWKVFQNSSGKLQVARTSNYDTATVAGVKNCENAILTRVTIEQGTLPENASYGFFSPIGDPQNENDLQMYMHSVERTVTQDSRFVEASATVSIEGNRYQINQIVKLAGATGGYAAQDVARGL